MLHYLQGTMTKHYIFLPTVAMLMQVQNNLAQCSPLLALLFLYKLTHNTITIWHAHITFTIWQPCFSVESGILCALPNGLFVKYSNWNSSISDIFNWICSISNKSKLLNRPYSKTLIIYEIEPFGDISFGKVKDLNRFFNSSQVWVVNHAVSFPFLHLCGVD